MSEELKKVIDGKVLTRMKVVRQYDIKILFFALSLITATIGAIALITNAIENNQMLYGFSVGLMLCSIISNIIIRIGGNKT